MPALLYPKMVITVENMDIRETIENRTHLAKKSLFGRRTQNKADGQLVRAASPIILSAAHSVSLNNGNMGELSFQKPSE
ncbi:hypothetical protein AB4Z22_06615 [Paenibacillus sp. TAF58]